MTIPVRVCYPPLLVFITPQTVKYLLQETYIKHGQIYHSAATEIQPQWDSNPVVTSTFQ